MAARVPGARKVAIPGEGGARARAREGLVSYEALGSGKASWAKASKPRLACYGQPPLTFARSEFLQEDLRAPARE